MAKTPSKSRAAQSKPAQTPSPRPLSAAELADLAAAWDAARSELQAAGDAVAAIEATLQALAPEADRSESETQLAAARDRVIQAQNAIAALTPLSTDVKLPDATQRPTARKPAPRPAQPTPSDDPLQAITVIGPVKGRRRAGFDFGAAPRTVLVTAEQRALIEADLSLSVTDGGAAPEGAAPPRRLEAGDFDFAGQPSILVKVLGPAKGRRRAGFEFGATARTVPVDPEQLRSILADAQLAVSPA